MNELQWTNETHFFIKIYLIHFILERGPHFVVSLRERWRDIYLEVGLLLTPYLLPGARGCQRLHPLAIRIVRDDLTPLIGLLNCQFWLDYLKISPRGSHITWSPSGYIPAQPAYPRRTAIPLFTNHNVTACQSSQGHQEQTQNPCQQSLYNKKEE